MIYKEHGPRTINSYDRVYYWTSKSISTLTITVLRLLLPGGMVNNTQNYT